MPGRNGDPAARRTPRSRGRGQGVGSPNIPAIDNDEPEIFGSDINLALDNAMAEIARLQHENDALQRNADTQTPRRNEHTSSQSSHVPAMAKLAARYIF